MCGTVSMANEPARSAILKAIEYAKKHNVQVACVPNLRDDLWHHKNPREHIFRILEDTEH